MLAQHHIGHLQPPEPTAGSASTDYIEGIEYEGGILSILHMAEERIVKSGGTYTYEYMLRDHLGNARSGFRHSAPTTASLRSDHYPFGLQYPQNVLAGTPVPSRSAG